MVHILSWLNDFFSCPNERIKLEKEIKDLKIDISSLKNDIELLKSLNISEFEQYLDNLKLPVMTLTYTKRWVFNKKNIIKMNICDFIRDEKSLPKLKNINKIFELPIKYHFDNFKEHGLLDFWQLPIETLLLGKGDCDDSGVLRASLARRLGNNNVFCALGFMNGVGHLFNMTMIDKKIYILENTSNMYMPILVNNIKDSSIVGYQIYFIFNENKCWCIRPGNFNSHSRDKILKAFSIKL